MVIWKNLLCNLHGKKEKSHEENVIVAILILLQGGLVYINCKCITARITDTGILQIPIAVNEVSFMMLNLESGVQ
jgi:hypothetical protein